MFLDSSPCRFPRNQRILSGFCQKLSKFPSDQYFYECQVSLALEHNCIIIIYRNFKIDFTAYCKKHRERFRYVCPDPLRFQSFAESVSFGKSAFCREVKCLTNNAFDLTSKTRKLCDFRWKFEIF